MSLRDQRSQPLDATQVHNPESEQLELTPNDQQSPMLAGLSSFSSNISCHTRSMTSEAEFKRTLSKTGCSHQEEPTVIKLSLKEPLGSEDSQTETNAHKPWLVTLDSSHGICSNSAAKSHHLRTEEAADVYFHEQAVRPRWLDRCELTDANTDCREELRINLPDKRRHDTIGSRPALEIRSIESLQKQGSFSPTAMVGYNDVVPCKHVAGVPVMSFDGVVIDSDLDSVRTEKVRAHIHKAMCSRRGCSPRRPLANRKESLRHRSSDDDVSDDEAETFMQCWDGSSWHRSPDCTANCRWDTQTDSCKDQKTLALKSRMNLAEYQKKLDAKTVEGSKLCEKNKQLEPQLEEMQRAKDTPIQSPSATASERKEALDQQMQTVTAQGRKVSALEKILSEKELEVLRLREAVASLSREKEAQASALETLKQEHSRKLLQLQEENQQEKGHQMTQQMEELNSALQQEFQQFAETVEQLKAHALKEQATSFKKEIDRLLESLKAKDAEITELSEQMRLQKDAIKHLAGELKQEAKEKVQNALLQEQRKWEMEKKKALQMQHEMLETEKHEVASDLKEVLEREKKKSLALQNKSVELQRESLATVPQSSASDPA
ncbi:uncharacterized protein LOC115479877 [Microcaecilia unicolor]|uniref:Uncharacterized protein LOC115479877 n=1 Tax=Microcaecilia unicolor TaxID=1415580 RepID=A0A6P7ZBW0_9AMPH|nr:uncharacterized protein LOC115479877 [Microcaecilia unicolor]